MAEHRLLILGGTGEAVALAARASEIPGLEIITSLAGRTRRPTLPKGRLRTGGFGGADGLATYLEAERIGLVVDATHPFAARIARHTAEACTRLSCPRLKLLRPAWRRRDGDRWLEVEDVPAAAARLECLARRAFLTIGRQELAPFATLRDGWFLVRLVEPPPEPLPLPGCEVVLGRGPFTVEEETELMTRHRIEALVSKHSGGDATYGKLAAARRLGLPVVMVRRPVPPAGEQVDNVAAALDWITARLR
jgi:precorrin-6A/cobalt-precorrin-6A reductase